MCSNVDKSLINNLYVVIHGRPTRRSRWARVYALFSFSFRVLVIVIVIVLVRRFLKNKDKQNQGLTDIFLLWGYKIRETLQ